MRPERRLLALLVLLLAIPGHVAADETAAVHILKVAAPIAPGVAGFVADALEAADREKAACIVIQLDTPGGLALERDLDPAIGEVRRRSGNAECQRGGTGPEAVPDHLHAAADQGYGCLSRYPRPAGPSGMPRQASKTVSPTSAWGSTSAWPMTTAGGPRWPS